MTRCRPGVRVCAESRSVECASWKTTATAATAKNNELSARVDELTTRLEAATRATAAVERQAAERQVELSRLQQATTGSVSEDAHSRVLGELEELQLKMASTRFTINVITAERDGFKALYHELRAAAEGDARTASLRDEIAALQSENARLKSATTAGPVDAADMRALVSELTTELQYAFDRESALKQV